MRPSIPDSNEVSSHEVIRGDSIKLECPAVGKPVPKITWLRAGQIVGKLLQRVNFFYIIHIAWLTPCRSYLHLPPTKDVDVS